MAPQELKLYILHNLCVLIMISVFPRSKTAYFGISDLEIEEKNVIKEVKNMKLSEIELHGTSRAEKLYFTISMCIEYGFGIPNV